MNTSQAWPRVGLQNIYCRTPSGQREAIFDEDLLQPPERRLLLRVNGYTALADLTDAQVDQALVREAAEDLVARGLIEEVDTPPPSFAHRAAPRLATGLPAAQGLH